MDKNLQNIDDLFSKAYKSFEDQPSPAVWEKLNAALDKEDAEKYRRRFKSWKRIAVILLLLLSVFVIYEARVITSRKAGLANRNNITLGDSSYTKKGNDNRFQNDTTLNDLNSMPGHEEKKALAGAAQTHSSAAHNKQNKHLLPEEINVKEKQEAKETTATISSAKNKKSQFATQLNKLKITNGKNAEADDNGSTGVVIKNVKGKTNTVNTVQPAPDDYVLQRAPVTGIEPANRVKVDLNSSFKLLNMPVRLPPNLIGKTAGKAQQKNKSNFNPYWIFTAFASNDWGEYSLENDVQQNSNNQPDEKEEISKREKHEASYSAGVLFTRQFTKRLGIKTGVIFSNTAIGIDPQEMYASKKPDGSVAYKYITSSGYGYVKPGFGLPPAVGDSIRSLEAQHNLQTVSIPAMLSYKMDVNKFSIVPSAGITANFITSAKVKTEVTDALNKESVTINGLDGMRSVYAGFIADINFQYNVNSRWAFNLLPSFKYALTPISNGNVVKTFPYSFNMGAGITYKFRIHPRIH